MTTLPSLLLLALAAANPVKPAPAVPPMPLPASPALRAEFKRIDTNEDGRVSSSEHEVYARKLFDELDADVDYKLTLAEILAAPAKFFRHVWTGPGAAPGGTEPNAEERILRVDANRDGFISRDEHADAARAKFQVMDVNNNGELSDVEFVAGG